MGKKEFLKSVIYNRNSYMLWLLVGLMRSLKSSHKEALTETLLWYKSDITSPTSNHIPDIDTTVYIVYNTF